MNEEKINSVHNVIKGLEFCVSTVYECDTCPYRANGCSKSLLSDALALILNQKGEVIKEFAERLTKTIFPLGYFCNGNYPVNAKVVKMVIDNLVKEMTEEKK